MEGFLEEVVEAVGGEILDFLLFDKPGNPQDPGVPGFHAGFHALADHASVHVGEVDVQYHQLGIVLHHNGPGIKTGGGGEYEILLPAGKHGGDNVEVVGVVIHHQYPAFTLFQPFQRDAVAEHELPEVVVRYSPIAARTEAVALDLAQIKPAGYGVGRDATNSGDFTGREYSILHEPTFTLPTNFTIIPASRRRRGSVSGHRTFRAAPSDGMYPVQQPEKTAPGATPRVRASLPNSLWGPCHGIFLYGKNANSTKSGSRPRNGPHS